MAIKFMYQVCAPSTYLNKGRGVFLMEYITQRAINNEYKKRLYVENLSIYNGFKGQKNRKELKQIVENEIYSLFSKKLETIEKWHEVKIENMGDFNEILIEAEDSKEARSKLEDVLIEIERFLHYYGIMDRINCYDIKNNIMIIRRNI